MLMALLSFALALQVSAGAPDQCELHVFPTEKITVATSLGNGLLLGAFAGRDQPKDIFLRDLPKETQISAVATIPDLASSLGYSSVTVVPETTSYDVKAAKKTTARLTGSQATCYAELVFTDVVYSSNGLNGRHIGSMSVLRRFDSGRLISVSQMGGAGKLSLYPSPRAEDQPTARNELVGAFRESIQNAIRRFAKIKT